MSRSTFGFTKTGQAVEAFVLKPAIGEIFEAEILTYGGTLRRLVVPDRGGCPVDVVLGCDSLEDYEKSTCYLGCIVGRVSNRIKNGRFKLDGKIYQLDTNNGPNHLHGGWEGFNRKIWSVLDADNSHVTLGHISQSGDEKYPGEISAKVTYSAKLEVGVCTLSVRYEVSCTSKTPVNLASHAYFNLTGTPCLSDHHVKFNADRFLPVDEDHLCTGRIESVFNSAFDFTKSVNLGLRMEKILQEHPEYAYDNYFCLKKDDKLQADNSMKKTAQIHAPSSGIRMNVETTYPGFQFYTGDYLENHPRKKIHSGHISGYGKNSGFCVEAHKYPDSVNNPHFPTIILSPNETYDETVEFAFSTID